MYPQWNERKKIWLWIEQKANNEFSQLMMAKSSFREIKSLDLPVGNHAEFVFSADGEKIIISSDINKSGRFQIYGFDLLTTCFWPLIAYASQLREPSLSPNQKDLLFVSDVSAVKKIYKTQVELTYKNCILEEN